MPELAPTFLAEMDTGPLIEHYKSDESGDYGNELVRRYQGRVYNFVYGLLKQVQDAEDATQDTFLQFHHTKEKCDVRAVEGRLFAIARQRAYRIFNKRRGMHPLYHKDGEAIEEIDRKAVTPDEIACQQERYERVRAVIGKLHEQKRRQLELLYFEGKTYRDAADEMGMKFSTFDRYVRRITSSLRESAALKAAC